MQCVLFLNSRIEFVKNHDAKHTINFKRPYRDRQYQGDGSGVAIFQYPDFKKTKFLFPPQYSI